MQLARRPLEIDPLISKLFGGQAAYQTYLNIEMLALNDASVKNRKKEKVEKFLFQSKP